MRGLLCLLLVGCVESRFDNPADPRNQATTCAFASVGVGPCCSMGTDDPGRGVCINGLCTDGTRKVMDPACGATPAPPMTEFGAGGGGGSMDVLGDRCAFNGVQGTCQLAVRCTGRSVPGVCGADEAVGCCLSPPDAGVMPDPCDLPLAFGEDCSPANDCCGDGLGCLAGLDQCVPTCDANAEPSGCPPRAVCSPNEQRVEGEPAPGLCIPGDDCVPGREDVACGGPATCLLVAPASFCLPAGARGVDEPCEPTTDPDMADENCVAGTACVLGRCRPACEDTCEAGRCTGFSHRLDGLPVRVCLEMCDLAAQDCAAGVCALADEDDQGRIITRCVNAPQGDAVHGESCIATERYWGSCTGGHVCADLGGGEARCFGLCDVASDALCAGGSRCVLDVTEDTSFGICLGDCAVFTDNCGAGEYCRFAYIAAGDVATGDCVQGPQTRGSGDTCSTVDAATGASDCAAGHLCAALTEGEPARCVRLCDPENPCAEGTCRAGIFGDPPNERVGICR